MERRPTIRDIAEKAGCHYSTVSLALRNNPKISSDKRKKIQTIAETLGYRPDPFLAALTAYRSEKRPSQNITCLAWLITSEDKEWGKDSSNYPEYYKGAKNRAEERGYRIEKFWVNEEGMTDNRMSNILYHRGIVGLLLPHSEKPRLINLNWEHFAPVCLGYSVQKPKLHMVAPNEYRNISVVLRETFLRGYRRPALVETLPSVVRFENHWLGAFLTEQFGNPYIEKIPPYLFSDFEISEFATWLETHKPDVLVTRSKQPRLALEQLGYSVPDDIGLANHCLGPVEDGLTGTTKNAFELGQMAVDFVVDMLHRNERGIPSIAKRHLVDGCWVEGNTLRPRPLGADADQLEVAGIKPHCVL